VKTYTVNSCRKEISRHVSYADVMFKIGQSSLSIRGDIKLHETTLKSGTAVGKFKVGTIHICERSDFITPVPSGF
jgi:hypothetical protein